MKQLWVLPLVLGSFVGASSNSKNTCNLPIKYVKPTREFRIVCQIFRIPLGDEESLSRGESVNSSDADGFNFYAKQPEGKLLAPTQKRVALHSNGIFCGGFKNLQKAYYSQTSTNHVHRRDCTHEGALSTNVPQNIMPSSPPGTKRHGTAGDLTISAPPCPTSRNFERSDNFEELSSSDSDGSHRQNFMQGHYSENSD